MVKKDYAVPIEVQSLIGRRVFDFNAKHLSKFASKYISIVRGKFIYLMYWNNNGSFERVCRLTYNGNLEDMDFAIYKYSTEKYDANEWLFPGEEYVDGTLEGAMRAGLEAYPIRGCKIF